MTCLDCGACSGRDSPVPGLPASMLRTCAEVAEDLEPGDVLHVIAGVGMGKTRYLQHLSRSARAAVPLNAAIATSASLTDLVAEACARPGTVVLEDEAVARIDSADRAAWWHVVSEVVNAGGIWVAAWQAPGQIPPAPEGIPRTRHTFLVPRVSIDVPPGTEAEPCDVCGGSGRKFFSPGTPGSYSVPCLPCDGTGKAGVRP